MMLLLERRWRILALLQALLFCAFDSTSLPWPRFSSNNKNAAKSKQSTPQADKALSSSSPLEPLLQVPCSLQLVPNTGDVGMVRPQHPIGTFCDTGAQRTCMSWETVQRLGLVHLMDTRYQGQATGVGHCRVLGRIPAQTVLLQFASSVGGSLTVLAPAITVLEAIPGIDASSPRVDLLLGLDFFRETNAVLDLPNEMLQLTSHGIHQDGTPANKEGKPKVVKIPFVRPGSSLLPGKPPLPDFTAQAKQRATAQKYASAKEFVVTEVPRYWDGYGGMPQENNTKDEDDSDSDSETTTEGKMDMRGL